MAQPQVIQGQAIGTGLSVYDSTALAALSPQGLSVGTQVYNVTVGSNFVLTVSNAALVPDQVVAVNGVTGLRWIVYALPAGSVPNSALANMAAHTIKSNLTASSASPADNTLTAVAAALPAATTSAQGMMTALIYSSMFNFGANLTDADSTINPLSDKASGYLLPAGTLTAGRVLTLGITGSSITTTVVYLMIQPQAQTLTIKNDTGATLLALTSQTQSVQVTFVFSSGHFALSSVAYVVN